MELLAKIGVLVVILIVIAGIIFALTYTVANTKLTAQQATNLVITDLKQSNPGATVFTINVMNSPTYNDSYDITMGVVLNATSPCPTLFIDSFDYPAFSLLNSTDTLFTTKCMISNAASTSPYLISSPFVAIARASNASIAALSDYINSYGYSNITVYASRFVNTFNSPIGAYSNVWLVNYTAKNVPYSEYVVIDYSSGSVLGNYSS